MTCIASIWTPRGIFMASDRATSYGDQLIISAIPKIHVINQLNGTPILLGVSGFVKNKQIMLFGLVPPDDSNICDPLNQEKNYCYVASQLIPAIRKAFQENMGISTESGTENFCGTMLIGYRNCIFLVAGDLGVVVPEKTFIAIGSGGEYATGALEFAFMTRGDKPISDKEAEMLAYLAVKAAAENSRSVEEPIDTAYIIYAPKESGKTSCEKSCKYDDKCKKKKKEKEVQPLLEEKKDAPTAPEKEVQKE